MHGAWMVGTTTMKEFAGRSVKLGAAGRRIERTDHVANPRPRRFAIGADAKGKLRFQAPEVEGDHVVLLVSEKVSSAYLAHLQDAGVSYLFCGRDQVEVKVALDKSGASWASGSSCSKAAAPSTARGWSTRSARSSCPWSMAAAGLRGRRT